MTCPTCNLGVVCGCERGRGDPHPKDIGHTVFVDRMDGAPCPDCDGSGLDKTRLEAAAAIVCREDLHPLNPLPDGFEHPCLEHFVVTRAAIRAYLDHTEET
jgi:hypothetical protein